ncbi:YSIRK-type signal peptide-containing protein [Fundicoccus sp. Sow4_F4]|uniref:YSIRK-type signal peptide-containing protein n=1 Tax=Fundicoccus sp. Sow4_F4 TaxID=3438783 RepID=UPI003F9311C9
MVGKNNKAALLRQSATRRPQYAIKKLSVGVVSVAVGSLLSLGVNTVNAEEVITESDVALVQDSALIEILNEDELIVSENSVDDEDVDELNNSSFVQIKSLKSVADDFTNTITDSAYSLNSETTNLDIQSQELAILESSSDDSRIVEEIIVSPLENPNLLDSDEEVLEVYIPVDVIKEEESTPVELIPENIPFDNNTIIEENIPVQELTSPIASEMEDAENLSMSTEYINFQLGKDIYVGNEQIKATLTVKNDKEITGAYINFGNTTAHEYHYPNKSDITYLESNLFDYDPKGRITKDESGNFIIDFILGEQINSNYYSFAPGQFNLNYLSLHTEDGNVFYDDGTIVNSSFFYKQFEEQDLVKANFENIPFETIYTTDEESIQDGKDGAIYYYTDGTQYISQSANEVKSYDYIDEPIMFLTEYKPNYQLAPGLTNILKNGENGITRRFYNELGEEFSYKYIKYSTNHVIEYGVSKDAENEKYNASKYIRNDISIVDIDTGFEVTQVNFNGDSYYHRMQEFITKFNNQFKTSLSLEHQEFINYEEKVDILNGKYIDQRSTKFYVKNLDNVDLRDHEFALVPDRTLDYDNNNYGYGQVNLFDNNSNQLLSFDYDYNEIETIIKNSLSLLDESLYYFDKVVVRHKIIDNFDIDIFVRERLSKDLRDAEFATDYTNNLTEVREGQNGTKYLYSDGSERIVEAPINKVIWVETELKDAVVVDSITVDRDKYAVDETVEVTITGRSKSALKELTIDFSDWSKMKMHYVAGKLNTDDIVYNMVSSLLRS